MLYDWIQIIFFVIGLAATFAIISGLFFALDKGPKKIITNNPVPEVSSPDFLLALSQSVNSPIEEGGSVEILNNGDNFFPTLLEELNKAERSITFTVYIWQDGKISDQILKVLVAKQKEGVQVRVLLDGFGGKGAPKDKFNELVAAGGKVNRFRTFKLGRLTRFHKRSHRRAIVIDGKVGFTGGMAVKDVWLGNASNPSEWRDMMFKVTGVMARSLQSAFTDLWASSSGEILFGLGIYPPDLPKDSGIKFIHLVSSPSDSMPLPKFMLLSMMAAKHKLYITTPYFIPDRHICEVLKERVHAGVDVRLMLPNENIDNKTARWNAQNFYFDLLQTGVKIYEYQPTFIHSKYMMVDGQWSVIGSPNQNFRSRNLDEENVLGILDPIFASQLEDTFVKDINLSKEISLKTWKKRGTLTKLAAVIARAVEEQS
jgi:cardiolipin synthase A/B